jgi:hypothetical protein
MAEVMIRHRTGGLAMACLVAVAGCGSSASKHAASSRARAESATSAATSSSTTAAANNEASKPPKQILSDAAAALRNAHSYAMQGTIIQNHQRLRLKLTTTSATSVDLAFSIASSTVQLIGLPSGSYIRGNVRFWKSQVGARAARIANHWIQVPSPAARGVTSSLGALAPATLSRCLVEDHGTLSLAGQTTIDGRSAILLKDAGNAPGSSPSVLAVSASGPPYPLRYVSSGRQRAGGRIDVCNNGKANDAHGTITFAQFGQVAPIQPPTGAEQLAPQGPRT